MVFIDVHCHIDFMKNIPKLVENARNNNVKIMINNGIDIKSNRRSLRLASEYEMVKCALGIYPIEALKLSDEEIDEEIEFIRKNKDEIIAIGEVGIDLKWSDEFERQKNIFLKFIKLAKDLDKPVIVHSRNAEEKVLNILEKNGSKKVILHCFNGHMKLVERAIKMGWLFSIPANITYSEHFQKMIKIVPLKQILCETDSPYLHPEKGKLNNEPRNIVEGYKKIAEIKGLKLQQIEKEIENNFKFLFNE